MELLSLLTASLLPCLIAGAPKLPYRIPSVDFITPIDNYDEYDEIQPSACCEDVESCVTVNVNAEALLKPDSITLPNGVVVTYQGSDTEDEIPDGFLVFTGENFEDFVVSCDTDNTRCFGRYTDHKGDNQLLAYCEEDDSHVLKALDMSEGEDQPKRIHAQDYRDEDTVIEEIDETTPSELSIKFYYTPEAERDLVDVEKSIQFIIDDLNKIFANSKIPITAYSLCREKAYIRETDTVFNEFMKQRNQTWLLMQADVAVLLVSKYSDQYCGMSMQKGFLYEITGLVVTTNCAMTHHTVAHEIGHILGADHDRLYLKTNEQYPLYPYGTGHLIEQGYSTNSSGFYTVMAVEDKNHRIRVPAFANPQLIFDETGTSYGSEDDNVAKVINLNRFKLAKIGDESSSWCHSGRDTSHYYENMPEKYTPIQ